MIAARQVVSIWAALVLVASGSCSRQASRWLEWPAEAEERAINLSSVDPGLGDDLSGAVWNPHTGTLWVCRNGPKADSRLWALEQDGAGLWRVATRAGRPGEWRQLGDSEGVTFADFAEEVVFVLVEGEERIHELDVSRFGEKRVLRAYDTRPHLPLSGADGAEGLTFVPDDLLVAAGFVDADGEPRVSRRGMGGLMLVGHQNGGGVFAFDLDRATGAVDFVGEYRVQVGDGPARRTLGKVVALEADRSSGALLIWHGLDDENLLSVVELASQPVPGAAWRAFAGARVHRGPSGRRYEGLALAPAGDALHPHPTLYLTVDDGATHALFRYEQVSLDARDP